MKTSSELTAIFRVPDYFDQLTPIRQHSLVESLSALSKSLPKGLAVFGGELPSVLMEHGIQRVVATRSYDTTGMLQQAQLASELYESGIALELIGSNYAVTPGSVNKDDGTALKVYTPFYKRWFNFGWPQPFVVSVDDVNWFAIVGRGLPKLKATSPIRIKAGEAQALRTWERFKASRLAQYDENRNRMDLGGTSHLSHALAHGEIHPRTLLVELSDSPGHEVFRKEIAWREFYADVLYRNPHTIDNYYEPRFQKMRYSDPIQDEAILNAWKEGKTGYPVVDAAMRQLNETGWMHNRARMIVASFLVKDLHFEWQIGARYFEDRLTDFDPASNSHGWQWTAGCGTDASPYYRVFNPVTQGEKFDPEGNYVRQFVPELRHIDSKLIHSPWELIDGYLHGYPERIVDHAKEREEALTRLEEIKNR